MKRLELYRQKIFLFAFVNCFTITFQSLSRINAILFGSHSNDFQPITEFIQPYGYPLEIHLDVATEDGYLLNMYRIPHGLNEIYNTSQPVAFLMHGLLGGAEDWVVTGPDHGLAFLLADAGYDVWMGNARGTTHSRKHLYLDPNWNSNYWKFSWHEIGVYDLPAMIRYIQKKTGQSEMFYVGHSQGTTAFFVMCSTRPEFNKYIKLMVALAPVAYMTNAPSTTVQLLSAFQRSLGLFVNIFGVDEIHPNNQIMTLAGQSVCHQRALTSELCANLLFLVGGYDSVQLNRSLVPLISNYAPTGASIRQFIHYGQGVKSGEFKKFDHGIFENSEIYGSTVPPTYNLKNVVAPVGLFYSSNDQLVAIDDVERLSQELPNVVYNYLVPFPQFNHLDFLYASDVVDLLYTDVYGLMESFL